MRIRKLHAWDEWHEANGGFPSKKWSNNAGSAFNILGDAAHPNLPTVGPDTAKYTQQLTQTGRLRYYWSMKSATAAPFDMSMHFRENGVNPAADSYYRVRQTDTNLSLIRYNAGVATTLQNIVLAAVQNTEYWFVLDINFTTGAYKLYRATHASPEDDANAKKADATDAAPLAGLANAEILLRTDASTDGYFDHFKVLGPDITNYVQLTCMSIVTDGAGTWKMEAVNDSGTATYAELALADPIEIAILDDSVDPPVEWVEFSGWVEELEVADAHAGLWRLGGRDLRSIGLIGNVNDSYVAQTRDFIIKDLTTTYMGQVADRIALTSNDVKAFAGAITRAFKAIPALQAITDLMRECGSEWHHVLTRDRRWKVSDVWPQAVNAAGGAITISEADGLIVDLIEHKDGNVLINRVRGWLTGGAIQTDNDAASQSSFGQKRTLDVVDLRVGVAGEMQARNNWWLNNFSSAYKTFELTCAGYIGLYPGEYCTLTLTSRGVVAKTYGCLSRTVGYPEPGVITFLLSEKDVANNRLTQKFTWESGRRIAGIGWDARNGLAQQV